MTARKKAKQNHSSETDDENFNESLTFDDEQDLRKVDKRCGEKNDVVGGSGSLVNHDIGHNVEQQFAAKDLPVLQKRALVSPSKASTIEKQHSVFHPITKFQELGNPRSFMTHQPEIVCRCLGGGIDLIWVDLGANEAFVNPFVSFYFNAPTTSTNKALEKDLQELRNETQIFACVPRRLSKEHDEPVYKDSKNGNEKYKKCYFVRLAQQERQLNEISLYRALHKLSQVSFVYAFEMNLLFNNELKKFHKVFDN